MFLAINNIKKYSITILTIFFVIIFSHTVLAQDNSISSTISLSPSEHIIPGGSLPVSIQLLNFGTPGEKVDVSLNFMIRDASNEIILSRTETVAVQTTASFTRHFQLPKSLDPGTYILSLDILHRNMKFPAIAEQQFIVERVILGYSLSRWYAALLLIFVPFLFIFIIWKRKQNFQSVKRDYDHVPQYDRTNYEIIHDIINAIHYHVGDAHMHDIVSHIPGLTLNTSDSHIKEITGPIEIVVSQLIHEYERITGKKPNVINHPPYSKKRVQTH